MSNYVKLLNNLEELSLLNRRTNLDKYIELIDNQEKSIVDALPNSWFDEINLFNMSKVEVNILHRYRM